MCTWWQWMQWVVDVTWLSPNLTGRRYVKFLPKFLFYTVKQKYFLIVLWGYQLRQIRRRTTTIKMAGCSRVTRSIVWLVWGIVFQSAKVHMLYMSWKKQLHYLAYCLWTSNTKTNCGHVWNQYLIMTKWTSMFQKNHTATSWVFCDLPIL